jgi:hypothetical protein
MHYKSGKEILHGGCGVGAVDERGMVVERVCGEEREIERGGGFWPANLKSECGACVISLGKKSFMGVVVWVL